MPRKSNVKKGDSGSKFKDPCFGGGNSIMRRVEKGKKKRKRKKDLVGKGDSIITARKR